MHKKIFILLLVIAACSSGKKKMNNKYDAVTGIPEKEMVAILADYHVAEGINAVINIKDLMSLKERDTINFLDSLIIYHGYSIAQFDSAIRIYTRDMEYYSFIYEKVISELSRLEGENNKKSQPK